MTEWYIADCIDPVEDPDDTPQIHFESEEQLREILNQFRQRRPGLVILKSPHKEFLKIHIGGPFAGLRWMKEPFSRHYKEAVANPICSPTGVKFTEEGDTNFLEPEALLPVAQVIEAIIFFYKTQRLPEWITWMQWNDAAKRMETVPAHSLPPVTDVVESRQLTPPVA